MANTEKTGRRATDNQIAGTTMTTVFSQVPYEEAAPKIRERRFIGWERPILHSVVDQLESDFASASDWDMRQLLIVLPSGLARRRLIELLALRAQQQRTTLYPPEIVTVGALPEQLYVAKRPFASDLVQNLAWMEALQNTSRDELLRVIPVPPAKTNSTQWLELGRLLAQVHRELASDRLDFDHVAKALGRSHPETPRWKVLASIQRGYLDELDRQQLWDIQTARLRAIEWGECQTSKQIIVLGCVDLNRTQRACLEAVGGQVAIWIAADPTYAACFDGCGTVVGEAWQDQVATISRDTLLAGNGPADQAELLVAGMAELGERFHAREITLGVPDAELIPEIKHHLALCGRRARYGPGKPLGQSEPVRLLRLIGDYIQQRSYTALAVLVRHPAFEQVLRRGKRRVSPDWLAQLDSYYKNALPKAADGFVCSDLPESSTYLEITKAVNDWLKPLCPNSRKKKSQPISQWVQPLLSVLKQAYEGVQCEVDDPVDGPLYSAASQTRDALSSLTDIPPNLEPRMSASELIEWWVSNLSGAMVPEPHDTSVIEMLGWLELALDDRPALFLTGVHDGVVPDSVNADPFLPNQLRRSLGMMDNSRRFARDLYALQVILHTREHLRIVVGKSDAEGDPLVPSRLLMACKLENLPARVLHLVHDDYTDVLPEVERSWKPTAGHSQLRIPPPEAVDPPTKVTVTGFRDYIQCPYRYYLKHVLRLRDQDDALEELDAAMFGNLIHDTLEELGNSSVGSSEDAEEVEAFLISTLHRIADQRLGPNPPAAVLIQLEQAEMRLSEFAPKQAARAREGWEIRYTEQGIDIDSKVMLGKNNALHLIGRIDRIDYHPETGNWAIWDYKTSERAKQPLKVHWTKKHGWLDLQLPLYRHVARSLGITGTPSLGYISIPKQSAEIGFYEAPFTQEMLDDADRLADEIATNIANREFWPEELAEVEFDDFGRICHSDVQHVTVDRPTRNIRRASDIARPKITAEVVEDAKSRLNQAQRSYPAFEPQLIRASAGTGKTFQLTNRLLQIVLSGQDIDPILATTFTRKAAGEITNRVLQRLAFSCIDDRARKELTEHLPDVDTSAGNCLAALRRVTRSIHRLRISTLDSFFAQLARSFSLEMGLPPGWSPMEPVQETQYQLQAISQMLDSHDRHTLIELVRMLAKGETSRHIASQISQTVSSGFQAYRNTTAEAWDQLPLSKAPSEEAHASALQTLEATAIGHKAADGQRMNLHHLASIGDWEAVIEHGLLSKALQSDSPTYYGKQLSGDLVRALELIDERATAEVLPLRRQQTLASYQVLEAYDKEYTAMIRRLRSLAFADVTYYLARWMRGFADPLGSDGESRRRLPYAQQVDPRRLEFRLDCGIQHLLLDEFQDTAPDQWQILQPLAQPLGRSPSTESRRQGQSAEQTSSSRFSGDSEHSFFCVGDTKQAIYGWRGGVSEIFDSAARDIQGIQQSELRDSYRSSRQVMDAVNRVFQQLPTHANFAGCENVAQSWAAAFPKHRTARTELAGYVRLQNGPAIDKDLSNEERKLVQLEHTAEQVAELIRHTSGSVGILLRTNADVGRMIGLLRDRDVTASQDGGNPLTDSVAVQLLLSLLHLADHPGDRTCGFHVANSPLAEHLPYDARRQPSAVAGWFRRQVQRRGLGEALETLADPLANHLSWWDQHRMQQLLRFAHRYQTQPLSRLRDFEAAVTRQRIALPSESQVKVMTIHKSKGLEFDAIYLPELDVELAPSSPLLVTRGDDPCQPATGVLRYMNSSLQSKLPKSWQAAFAQQKQRGVSESLCMLYVAMTRARHALIMTARPNKNSVQQFGSLLQSTLAAGEQRNTPEAIIYEDGDPHWYRTLAMGASSTQLASGGLPLSPAAGSPMRLRVRTDTGSAPLRGMKITNPARSTRHLPPRPLGHLFSLTDWKATSYGSLIHAFFEQVEWLEDFDLVPDHLRQIALARLSPESLMHVPIEPTIEDFARLLQLPSVRGLLTRDRYHEPGVIAELGGEFDRVTIETERAISVVLEDRLVAGSIDRLALLLQNDRPVAAEIIDFKTDQFDSDESLLWLQERIEHHRPQLEIYGEVIAELYAIPRERVRSRLAMLAVDQVVDVASAS